MELWSSLAAAIAVASALAAMRARRPMMARVALGLHGLSLALMLAALSMPLVAVMGGVLGVVMALMSLLVRREDASVKISFAIWPMMREFGLLCLVLLFWSWLRRPTFIEGLFEVKASAQRAEVEVLGLLYTRYAGALLGVGLMLLAAVIGAGGQGEGQ